ncbi:ATPase get3 [Neolecta irregularis DAH-3]|uniref:ATPase get3 n=1 Tax=Neolecta irregularis (strain DAH-3) TaxID=1198029 RepID=A0A1U7LLI6_NEOID|nr:ATPase get3 [Neolecta irregularis DAH-3]|eukprot:OLL23498.1 ATPase get3 [Neolecta irregularis DAH-3]
MEIDSTSSLQEIIQSGADSSNPMSNIMQDLSMAVPGIDEAMSFTEVMKQVKSMEYSVVVFDTAPTGHTLRFLQFPTVLEKALAKISSISGRLGPMMNQVSGMMGLQDGTDDVFKKLEGMRETINQVNKQFTNPDLTTFICVCISEFLSLYETERMIQDLTSFHIDTHNIVVNQLVRHASCDQCSARYKMQRKYLEQYIELYAQDFHVVKVPLLTKEVRGPVALEEFSHLLIVDQGLE